MHSSASAKATVVFFNGAAGWITSILVYIAALPSSSIGVRVKVFKESLGTLGVAALLSTVAAPAQAQVAPEPVATSDTAVTASTSTAPTTVTTPAATTTTTAPTTTAPAASPAIVVEASLQAYKINPGDQIEIYVWGEERLQRQVKVLPDGTLAFPLVGQLIVAGLLPRQLETLISERLQPQYRGQVPQVTVSVVAPLGLQFSVMGKVRTPGTFSPGRYVNLLEALSLAGGPAPFANLDGVVIYRKAGAGLSTVRVRLAPYFKSGSDIRTVSQEEIPAIESGDTVVVP